MLYFVKVKGDNSGRVYTARQELNYIFRDTFKKEDKELEIVCPVPHEVACACVSGVKILNMARTMGFYQNQKV